MKHNTKEFEELRSQFELDLKSMPVYAGSNPDMEPKIRSGHFYCDHTINMLFIGYMYGYQNAKCLARMDALILNED